ncbi:hypothetical protein PMIN06_001549 [Paraphaeosphaeria minitans]
MGSTVAPDHAQPSSTSWNTAAESFPSLHDISCILESTFVKFVIACLEILTASKQLPTNTKCVPMIQAPTMKPCMQHHIINTSYKMLLLKPHVTLLSAAFPPQLNA